MQLLKITDNFFFLQVLHQVSVMLMIISPIVIIKMDHVSVLFFRVKIEASVKLLPAEVVPQWPVPANLIPQTHQLKN